MSITIAATLPSVNQLPDTFLIALESISAIALKGEDQTKYLQGQVTCDVNAASENTLLVGAHCNAKGKVFSVFRLINRNSEHLLIQPKVSLNNSITELKKFGVFAKVEITQTDELSFFALAGKNATAHIQSAFKQTPDSMTPVIISGTTTLVYIAGKQARYLLIDQSKKLAALIAQFDLPTYSSAVWDLLEIIEGFPQLSNATSTEYVPQMLNLQAIHGISFTKGCYLGQETVARMQYLGKNKRALFSLAVSLDASLTLNANQAISANDVIEKQLGENWRKAGDILTSYQADNGECYLQAVLANDVDKNTSLRIKEQTNTTVVVQTLPYSIETE